MSALFTCKHCGSEHIFLEQKGNNTGVYCTDCEGWIAWVGKRTLKSQELKIQIDDSSVANLERSKRLKERKSAVSTKPVNSPIFGTDVRQPTPKSDDTKQFDETNCTKKVVDNKQDGMNKSAFIKLNATNLTIYIGESIAIVPSDGFIKATQNGLAIYDKSRHLVSVHNYD